MCVCVESTKVEIKIKWKIKRYLNIWIMKLYHHDWLINSGNCWIQCSEDFVWKLFRNGGPSNININIWNQHFRRDSRMTNFHSNPNQFLTWKRQRTKRVQNDKRIDYIGKCLNWKLRPIQSSFHWLRSY